MGRIDLLDRVGGRATKAPVSRSNASSEDSGQMQCRSGHRCQERFESHWKW